MKKIILAIILVIIMSSVAYAQGWESGDYYARMIYEPAAKMIFTQQVALEASKEKAPAAVFTLKNANDMADDYKGYNVEITVAEGTLLSSELQVLISADGCKFEKYKDKLCKPTDTTQLEENIGSLNGLMDQAPDMVKSIFGSERMNFYILEKPMLTFNVITSNGAITEIGNAELEDPTMIVLIKKGTLRQIREGKLTPMDALDNGKIEYKGVRFLKKIKAGFLNLGLKLFSLFKGGGSPPPVDSDGDGITDDADDCPYDFGVADNNGCPAVIDSDGDGIEDSFDLCPYNYGVVDNNGCPSADSDSDGINDDIDACPMEAGPTINDGCPYGDYDGDGVYDDVDQCPDQPGPASNNGCPAQIDSDGDGVNDNIDACPVEAGPASANGCPLVSDQDGDGIADADDRCPQNAGPASNKGCPVSVQIIPPSDQDSDGVPDSEDLCPQHPGPAKNRGCQFILRKSLPDSDGDGVIDDADQCPMEAGFITNDGCPSADSDGDGFDDANDNCPQYAGTFGGCPIVSDQDGDGIADAEDQCPQNAGPASNNGCPVSQQAIPPSDQDGDGVPDSEDLCPQYPGPAKNRGCSFILRNSRLDSDGDGVIDDADQCPMEAGDVTNNGCPAAN